MIKHGVDLRGLTPVWGIAFPLIVDVYRQHGQQCRMTSATDGVHGARSLHPSGNALDLGTHQIKDIATRQKIARDIQIVLGPQFDVVFEAQGEPNEHIHVEFDPKEKA